MWLFHSPYNYYPTLIAAISTILYTVTTGTVYMYNCN